MSYVFQLIVHEANMCVLCTALLFCANSYMTAKEHRAAVTSAFFVLLDLQACAVVTAYGVMDWTICRLDDFWTSELTDSEFRAHI